MDNDTSVLPKVDITCDNICLFVEDCPMSYMYKHPDTGEIQAGLFYEAFTLDNQFIHLKDPSPIRLPKKAFVKFNKLRLTLITTIDSLPKKEITTFLCWFSDENSTNQKVSQMKLEEVKQYGDYPLHLFAKTDEKDK